jgi:ribokinase
MLKPILVVGSINLDLVVHADRIPAPGETIRGTGFQEFCGGKGANQAVGIARLGYPVSMLGHVGGDDFGVRLKAGLGDAGVDIRTVDSVSGPSGVALITRGQDGSNSIVVVAGANGTLTPKYIRRQEELIVNAGMILLQLEIPLDTVECVADIASHAGVPVMLDPAPSRILPPSLLQNVSWLTPNETETQFLIDRSLRDISPNDAAEKLLASGARNVALKMGKNGVYLAGRDCPFTHKEAVPVTAIDTTAAGDAFNAAFAVRLTCGDTPPEAAMYANAAAAISVTRLGAQPSMPTAVEVENILQGKLL